MKLATIVFAALLSLQTQAILPPTTPPRTAAIGGIVRDAGTGTPIAGVEVTLRLLPAGGVVATPQAAMPPLITDANGGFLFPAVFPGTYVGLARNEGYSPQVFGSGTPGRTGLGPLFEGVVDLAAEGALIEVNVNQGKRELIFELSKLGVVSGRIVDSGGKPLSNVNVRLLPDVYSWIGQKLLIAAQPAVMTTDRGDYRFAGVDPGRYYLLAFMPPTRANPGNNAQGFVPTYYPGTPAFSDARTLEVRPNSETAGGNMELWPRTESLSFSVRGRIVDAQTGTVPFDSKQLNVSLIPKDAQVVPGMRVVQAVQEDGTFELTTTNFSEIVSPGRYLLRVERPVPLGRSQLGGAAPTASAGAFGFAQVDIFGGEIDAGIVSLAPPTQLRGRITAVQGEPARLALDNIQIRLLPPTVGGVDLVNPPKPSLSLRDGTFVVENVSPGAHRLLVAGLPPDAYVKEATFGRLDILTQSLSLAGTPADLLNIVISSRAGAIAGSVVARILSTKAVVVLVPDERNKRPDLYRTAMADPEGRFQVRNVAPGMYKVFAWDKLERFAYFDPTLIAQHENDGVPVVITEAMLSTVSVPLIQTEQR